MEEILSLINFTKYKKKRPANKATNKITEFSEDIDDYILVKETNEKINNEIIIDNMNQVIDGQVYSYDLLLERISNLIKKQNPKMAESGEKKIKITIPIVNKVGNNRSSWANFSDICTSLDRPHDHIYNYILAQLGVEGNLGAENQFLIKSRITNKHIEQLLRKYIQEYVKCANCKSSATKLKRDNTVRLLQLDCTQCEAHRTVAQIKQSVAKKIK